MIAPTDIDADFRQFLNTAELRSLFQPVVELSEARIFGYEGLIRGPRQSALESADALFAAATRNGLDEELEVICARAHVIEFVRSGLPGRLLLNLSGDYIVRAKSRIRRQLRFLFDHGLSPGRLVAEITEHRSIEDPVTLAAALAELRDAGLRFALDDFGDGRSSLRLWVESQPEYVKLDRYFIHGIDRNPAKFQAVRSLVELARDYGTRLIAEGIETEEELGVLSDLGIAYGQGFLLGRPQSEPLREVSAEVRRTLASRRLAVFPESVRAPGHQTGAGQLAVYAPTVTAHSVNDELVGLFNEHPGIHALAVVEGRTPIGLINRHAFMDRYVQPYQRELYGRKSCTAFMNATPLIVDKATPIEDLARLMAGENPHGLADGFIVTDKGAYLGLGSGEALIRAITETRVEAARYANPLTFLPGNIPISEHIVRLLTRGVRFQACYADLDHFKPYNDQYGYRLGDEMIKLCARVLADHCDPASDFLGHIGGDDFLILFQSEDWQQRCKAAISQFNERARLLYSPEALEAGGLCGEDRAGNPTFFPLTTVSIGAVQVDSGTCRNPEGVASAAAAAKRIAKQRRLSLFWSPERSVA